MITDSTRLISASLLRVAVTYSVSGAVNHVYRGRKTRCSFPSRVKFKAFIETLPSVDRERIYILGHSMGGHGTYIFIQLDPDYFAAAAPSAGSGLKSTEE